MYGRTRGAGPRARAPPACSLPEDPRISKLLRRLACETEGGAARALIARLRLALGVSENARYVRRSHEAIGDALVSALHEAADRETRFAIATALAHLGLALAVHSDFCKHLDWLADKLASQHSEEMKTLLVVSLRETLKADAEAETPALADFAEATVKRLQTIVETTDSSKMFNVAVDAMVLAAESYPEAFDAHFIDTVDILIGWHMDASQNDNVKEFALDTLEKFAHHWRSNAAFSVNLLGQFVDDMTAYGDNPESRECVRSITSFMNVFNTIVKSLGETFAFESRAFLSESLERIVRTFRTALAMAFEPELVVAGNECVFLLLDRLRDGNGAVPVPDASSLYALVKTQLENLDPGDEKTTVSFLNVVRKMIKEMAADLSSEFVETIVGPNSPLSSMKNFDNDLVRMGVVSVYRNLLNLKNIPLLQDAYGYVLEDLQSSLETLVPDVDISHRERRADLKKYTPEEARLEVVFCLHRLSDLANASNSIIGMWALRPSILELLAVKMKPFDGELRANHPTVQFSIVYLLYSHCKRNNHFIASSDLIERAFGRQRSNVCDILRISNIQIGDPSGTSPTCGHFAVILSLLNKLFRCKPPADTLVLSLDWTLDIFTQLSKSYPAVFHLDVLIEVIVDCLNSGFCTNVRIIRSVIKNLKVLLSIGNIRSDNRIMRILADLCMIHVDNRDGHVRNEFCSIFAFVPWDITLDSLVTDNSKCERYKPAKFYSVNLSNVKSARKEHLTRDTYGQMSAEDFKSFVNYLLYGHMSNCWDGRLKNSFLNCWPVHDNKNDGVHLEFFRRCGSNFSSVLSMWATWEAARLCTTSKLRTPLGKPQETFKSIESSIKQLARELSSVDSATRNGKENKVEKLKRCRLIVEFFECLEKSMVNAVDGCAVVLLPMEKPVRTFFHTNSMTCQEWVNRVRPAVILVSIHSGHAAAAVRHAQSSLHNPTVTNTMSGTSSSDLLVYCVSLARAYLSLREPEALFGLYTWMRQTYGKKAIWLKIAADQAASKYETAIVNYSNLLCKRGNADNEPKTDEIELHDSEKKFILEQMIKCYQCLQQWNDLIEWKTEKLSDDMVPLLNFDFESVSCYAKFQNDDIIFPNDLCNWDILSFNEDHHSINDSSDTLGLFDKMDSTLKNIAMRIMFEPDYLESTAVDNIEQCLEFIQNSLHELSRNRSCELLSDIHIMHYAAIGTKSMIAVDRNSQMNPFYIAPDKTLKNYDPSVLCKIMWWCEYFMKLRMSVTENDISFMDSLRLDLIKSSRKHGNYLLSKREIIKYFGSPLRLPTVTNAPVKSVDDICDFFLRTMNSYHLNMWSPNNVIAIMELSKLLYVDDNSKETAMNLCASASLGVSQRLALGDHTYEFREKGTRMLLTLSKWVQNETDKLLTNNLNSPLTKLVTALPEIGLVNNSISAHVIPISDSAVGKLLQFSVNQCPGFAKAWFTFGSWCFRWGKKMVEYSSSTGGQLSESDKMQIQSIILQGNTEDFEAICNILSKTRVVCDDDDINWSEINTSDMIENQLRSVSCLRNAYSENLNLLVDIWRQAQKRVFSYYELAADAYFKFLDLSSSSDIINHNGECAIVTATLRLLKLIVKHAMELQNVLETGLSNTPTQPWKVIIPQLFSRLNHPENYVRRRVSELLCRIAEDAPHLITFPAVVGAVENKRNNLTDFSLTKSIFLESEDKDLENIDSPEENENDDSNDDILNSCFMDMVDTLSKQAPETILQVQLLVKELRRINLLWDELWLRTLVQHQSAINKRLVQLNNEINKVNTNSNLEADEKTKLINEKYHIFMKPILFVLEQLTDITSASPETPYEKAFQDKFLESINDTIEKLKNPVNPEKPDIWSPIKQLQTKLQQKSNKRSPYTLKMSDISPILSNMSDTVISMPGVWTSLKVRITIMSIDNNVAILPSKTKPKKIIFHGSDGKTYTYLFKGLEDLHLDERIMQFLSITNIMMAQDKEDNSSQTYRARHYSVIPLGPRSGLISWVDNLTPLFALYKRWQQREAVISAFKNNSNKPPIVLRPSELFYNKLIPLLNTVGVSVQNRKEWPITILKQVLVELMAETPKDLLAKELWSSSITPNQWWHTIRRYSYSVAVMSTIGYIIGLGDRHLDNVLIDLSSGEVVHIDYNVCFEDGKTLRVPEKVPFRMTPNLERCLGVTGVEGIFRMACEHVLKTMKRGRKTLLTLLEAFVYDPLVEWSGETSAGAAGGTNGLPILFGKASSIKSAAVERRCGLDLLAVRLQEMRHAWNENSEDLQKQLPLLLQNTIGWSEQQQALVACEAQLQQFHRQLALVKELEALGGDIKDHPLYLAAQRYSTYKQMKDTLEESAKNLIELHEECSTKIESYSRALETIKGPQLTQWIQELNFPIDHDGHNVFHLIHEFLMNAGQSSMISQCEQAEIELSQCARQQTLMIKNCLELLSQFAAVAQYFPQSSLEKHHIFLYKKWTEILLETESPEVCGEVMIQIRNFRISESTSNISIQHMTFSYQLQTVSNEINIKLNKLYERLKTEGGSDAILRSEQSYLDATNAISNFVSQGNGSEKAIECFIINTLISLNTRFLMLETGAQSAENCLVDLMSREGEWFIDDMAIISSLVTEFITFLPSQISDERIPRSFECLNACKVVFSDLKELISNFQMIILPEAIRKVQAEEPSVLLMINELNAVVVSTGCSLNDLISQLEHHLRCVVREIESPTSNAHRIIAELKTRYKNLVNISNDGMQNSSGQMLLMGTDGLFAHLNARGAAILDTLSALNIPLVWKKIDHITDANDLAACLNNEQIKSVLDDIFFIKRIQAIVDFFNLCVQMSCAFKGVGQIVVYDDETLSRPIKRFMADYVSRQFLGVQSQCVAVTVCLLMQKYILNINKEIEQRHIGVSWKVPLNELCEVSVSNSIKSGLFTTSLLQQANNLCNNLEIAFRRRETLQNLETSIQVQRSCANRLRLQLTAFTWLHGEGIGNASVSTTPSTELRRAAQQLAVQRPHLIAALEKHRSLVSSAEQRLKWAAGANPALNDVMAGFECAVNIREDRLKVECALAATIGATCSALGNLNLLPNGNLSNRDITTLATRRRSALTAFICAPAAPLPLHETLLQLLRPEINLDSKWIAQVSTLISDKILQLQKSTLEMKTNLNFSEEKLKKSVTQMGILKRTHENVMFDLKNLLKVFAKTQDNIGLKAYDYLIKHKSFMSDLTSLIDNLNTSNLIDKAMQSIDIINKLELQLPNIFREILSFDQILKDEESSNMKRRGTLVRQMAGVWNSPIKQINPSRSRNQKVNAYAVSVWQRVRLKLEGRDPDPVRKYSYQEQVDYIIKEAMSLDNLCLLYEGWTPWV